MDLEDGCYKLGSTVLQASLACREQRDDDELEEFTGDSESLSGPEAAAVRRREPKTRASTTATTTTTTTRPTTRTTRTATTNLVQDDDGGWTNDKHVSYLNSMEQAFVRKLYSRNQHQPWKPGKVYAETSSKRRPPDVEMLLLSEVPGSEPAGEEQPPKQHDDLVPPLASKS